MNTYRKSLDRLLTSWLRVSVVVGMVLALTFSSLGVTPTQAKPLYALGTYPATNVVLGGNTTITPSAVPTGTTSINVSTNTNFKGTFVANTATGVVRVINAHPAGTYTITVRAFGASPATTTFTLTVTSGVACTATPAFYTAPNVNVGTYPFSVAVGDFNGDGNQDFAAANLLSDNVSIGLGDGAGGFSGTTNVSVGTRPYSVAVGDFNNDGNQDFAAANYGSNTVSIRLGDGLGGFSGTTNVSVGTNPWSVAVGDFNNDGNQDFAAANGPLNTVSIRLGDGAGGFSGTTNVVVDAYPVSVTVGDFNNDGNQDFAAANVGSNTVSIRLGDGAGGFSGTTNIGVQSAPYSVAVGDFNNDGNQDFAAANGSSNTVSIRLGDGAGGFSGTTNIGVQSAPFSVAVGDFNNDGNQDFAAANGSSSTVSIRLGNGAGGFSGTTNVSVGTNPWSVAVGDFNNDGKQDFAATNRGSNNVSIRLGYLPLCYNGNGNDGGSAPASATYAPGATVTVSGNTGSLVKTGYTFSGWNTAADGSGTAYAPAATFNITTPTILYAQWTANTYTVTYDGNGNTGGSAPGNQTKTHDVDLTLATNSGNLARTGYTFTGWNTQADGLGTHYDVGGTYTANAAVTLYAEWTINTYTVSYDGNGNTGGSAPGNQTKTHDVDLTLATNSGNLARTGYTFTGWNTQADGLGTHYEVGGTYITNAAVTLYAQWNAVVAPGAGGGNGPGGVGITDGSSSLEVWLKGDAGIFTDTGCSTAVANGQDAACWQDQSGNNVNVTQATSTRRPTYNTAIQNGMPALTYVGGSNGDVLVGTLSAYSGNQAYTIFSAFNPSNNTEENLFAVGTTGSDDGAIAYHPRLGTNRLLYHWNDDLVLAGTVAGWQTEAFRYTAVAANPNQYIYTNSNLAGSRQTIRLLNLPANPELSVGGFNLRTGSYGHELTGNLGEMIFFSQSLADVDRILVENYLSAKYNVALSANDVYNGDDSGNGNFDLDMAGIGRFGGNNHTQAHSAGIIVVNRTFLQDNGDWLTFGHLTPTSSKTTADVPTSGDWLTAANPMRWARHWAFMRTDAAGTTGGTVDIIFDFSEGNMNGGQPPAGPTSNYRLLRRENPTGTFEDIATASAIVGDQVQFLGVDVSLLGSNFTLGTLHDANSPTAIGLQSFEAVPVDQTSARFVPIGLGAILLILSGTVLVINCKRRRSQA